jgi:ribonuclease HIII
MLITTSIKKVQLFIETGFKLTLKPGQLSVHHSFDIFSNEGKITFTYFASKKLLIQSSPSNSVFSSLSVVISELIKIKPDGDTVAVSIDELSLASEYYVGCDESGKGESFGSMFLGCAMVSKHVLSKLSPILKNKNIRNLSKSEINELVNATEGQYRFLIKCYTACYFYDL